MRDIDVKVITQAVKKMCISANINLGEDVVKCINERIKDESSPTGRDILEIMLQNVDIAKSEQTPLCQDTGMAVIFMEVGQDVHFTGGNIVDAVNEGVRQGYSEGYLRKSVVSDPLIRENTGDNTPAVIYTDIVPGENVKIVFAPKGFGSENMSRTKMLKPSDGVQGVIDFVVETVSIAGPNPCPPVVVGVGIGGTIDKAAQIAKKALTREIGKNSEKEHIIKIEQELLERINELGIGPQGLGGNTTALAVNVEVYPTHIAGLPVAVNINCHVARHEEITI
ncbi:fumarate hydratase subunit alpha [Peptoclostridium litorale DSM 5388]|uniref:Putative fumarate hydratase subunit alpha n=1 Tax=Peptoclostridium litorale DSM 5388 TaxID=1121324 RepID=A0A069RCS7_PEPLI|nr:fumarate hydratase [Peptoclostridium litorale]KDR94563.1 putative fumarate hydratase subunit alpha [Peptoclostridium litorale DSM 5388]SIO31439.1 fumarate hydratase subunit alpha [Peptoclostridium litorale DSM 5388]